MHFLHYSILIKKQENVTSFLYDPRPDSDLPVQATRVHLLRHWSDGGNFSSFFQHWTQDDGHQAGGPVWYGLRQIQVKSNYDIDINSGSQPIYVVHS